MNKWYNTIQRDIKTPLGFWETNRLPNLNQTIKHCNNQQKRRTCQIVDFAVPADHRVKLKESKKKDNYLDLTRELKKTVEHESDSYTNCNWCPWYSHQRIGTGTGGLENKRMRGDHPKYSIAEKSPGDLKRLSVTQTPVRNHQLTLVFKTWKGVIIIIIIILLIIRWQLYQLWLVLLVQ